VTTKIDPRNLFDIVRRPIISEKATILMEQNKFVFEVTPQATKPQIKEAIESLFDVKVKRVDTHNPPRKSRRIGKFAGHKPQYKRAIVTIVEGQTITLFPEV
jgi:large subunit ribosomal protein L23